MSGYHGRHRPAGGGAPQGIQRSYASQLKEREPMFHTYEHLQGLPRGDAALEMLRKIASMVKPIMRKRNWKVQILAEFLPPEQNLLGLNINRGYKICIRLRYHNNPDLFLPMEQLVDTMLHELSHNVWGEHDANFHRLWDELRDEQETLIRKGYTGEGFLSEGKRLGGGRSGVLPPHEMRRLARASAEKRQAQSKLSKGSGQRLGGTPLHLYGGDVRNVIADQITRRNTINKGCASGRADAVKISDEASNHTFKTQAEEDDANNRAILQALYDLIEEEEERKLKGTFSEAPTNGGLAWDPETGLYDPTKEKLPELDGDVSSQPFPSEEEQLEWAMSSHAHSNPHPPTEQSAFSGSGTQPIPIPQHPQPVPLVEADACPAVSELSQEPTSTTTPVSPELPQVHPDGIPTTTATRTEHYPASSLPIPVDDHQHFHSHNHPHPHPSTAIFSTSPIIDLSAPFDPNPPTTTTSSDQWTCEICTCINPLQFLACDACGTERPQRIGLGNRGARPKPAPGKGVPSLLASTDTGRGVGTGTETGRVQQPDSLGWICGSCGAFMEHRWWTCSACGRMKESS